MAWLGRFDMRKNNALYMALVLCGGMLAATVALAEDTSDYVSAVNEDSAPKINANKSFGENLAANTPQKQETARREDDQADKNRQAQSNCAVHRGLLPDQKDCRQCQRHHHHHHQVLPRDMGKNAAGVFLKCRSSHLVQLHPRSPDGQLNRTFRERFPPGAHESQIPSTAGAGHFPSQNTRFFRVFFYI